MKKYIHKFTIDDFKITVKLPKSYFKKLNYFYPLLCVQDGDSLFKNLNKDIIFVGIESKQRSNDFTPWEAQIGKQKNGGLADKYLKWLTEELIPVLRHRYRVSNDNKDIGIAGASYGALVSLYALYQVPNSFGTYILISPSVWYPNFIDFMKREGQITDKVTVYWYVGLKEGIEHTLTIKDMVKNSFEGVKILNGDLNHKEAQFKFQTNSKGIHRHRFFKKYFKKALKYAYK
ncbi:alpha/beta hydrolase [Staphylococcus schleiferi subsp. coagulans]|uniref:alpha/beta hydrolase n=1 Tax=Staphylococcus coagulans TaxID=74706 RepID=UPI0015F9C1C3|nr:alpha/beta hydrolase-fold protein [Staphylococcus coagulans]MBA8779792.1 alpha/beta hydrolase [Staphylococcus coagulans]